MDNITSPLSGFRDLLPEQMIPRQYVLSTIERIYQLYGFAPLETPILERYEVMAGKFGEEGEKLMYRFEDHGGRMVALRYDQTVPLARVAAEYSGNLPHPFKRYVVGPVFRGERAQKGRYRQFTQFDADIVGTSSPVADAEIVMMMSDSMSALGVRSLVRVNNRLILDALSETVGLTDEPLMRKMVGVIDKIDKIGRDAVLKELTELFDERVADIVSRYLSVSGSAEEKIVALRHILVESVARDHGLENISAVFEIFESAGYHSDSVIFDPTIARGLDYYTGIIYETNLIGAEDLGSVCSGGRYDRLISALGGPDLPAVGTSVGVDRLIDALGQLGKLSESKTTTQVLVTNFGGNISQYVSLVQTLRAAGIAAELAYDAKKGVGKQMQSADAQGIPLALIYGEDEQVKNIVTVRNLRTREQTEVAFDGLVEKIKSLLI